MNSDKNDDKKLPDGWVLCKSKSNPGRKYYFNKKTGKSSWTQPQADEQTGNGKQKTKKKSYNQEKSKKEDMLKKNLKRKSEGSEVCPSKKHKSGLPERHSTGSRIDLLKDKKIKEKESPNKSNNNRKTLNVDSPIKQTPSKNLANNRLSKLRAQLDQDIQKEESCSETSPQKGNKHKISPNASQTDVPSKVSKLDSKSPSLNDSKCSTTSQSPSSDSLQSIPSPSQFLAANKIISSMKAQLPEEYCNKIKQKDTFADIEEGICSQTTEYPFLKHPATPPQFSEASKLVSAIKSKLTYKTPCKDNANVKTFTSAKERMETLRASLNETGTTKYDISKEVNRNEAMDVEEFKEIIQSPSIKNCTKNVTSIKGSLVLVVDTNIFIHELEIIKNVLNAHIKGYSEQPTLLVPWRVINELDRLKDSNNGNAAICKRAKSAMDYLYKSLPENTRIKGQSLRDANSHIYPCEIPDDEILNCCLQQAERGNSVILLSNDKNLCNKAMVNNVKCIALCELKGLLESKPQPAMDRDLGASVKHYQKSMYQLLANILENELRAKYNNLWQHVLFKPPPWSLDDVLQCLLKHWIAVFNEVFPRIEHLITELRNTLLSIENKNPKNLSQSEVSNFKDLCLDVARKCQIIPEYMELAKTTVQRLLRDCESETVEGEKDGEMRVIDAFEGLWTVFSSYCAKLSSALRIPHSIEDKLPGDDNQQLITDKWPVFTAQINSLTSAIKWALGTDNKMEDLEEQVSRLEVVFKESLELISMDGSAITRDGIRVFCTNNRNMLQEAYTKFTQLTELLDACKQRIASK